MGRSALAAEITVSAAVSLKAALEAVARQYQTKSPDHINFNFGSTGALQRQIEHGAPVDVFFAASSYAIDDLARQDLVIVNTRRDLLRNELVLIVPKGTLNVQNFVDLEKSSIRRVALGEPNIVPAGEYAKQALSQLKLLPSLKAKLVYANNVRQVLTYVERQDVDAGFVYLTDAKDTSNVRIAAKVPAKNHNPIIYPVVVLKHARQHDAAKRFVHWLASDAAKQVFQDHGFLTEHDGNP